MLRKVYRPRGLNLRDTDINRPPEFAQDLRNVEKSSKGEIILRWGIDKLLNDTGIIDLFEYVGAQDDPNRGSLLALKADGIYRWNGTTLVKINDQNLGSFTWTDQTKPVEYNKILYWNDPRGEVDLWKFDGYGAYRAGSPPPLVNQVSTEGTTYFWRIILAYYDPQGNVTYSDYVSMQTDTDSLIVNFEALNNAYYNGFYQKFSTGVGIQVIDSGNLTISGITNHNYVAGDYMVLGDYSGGNRKPILIDSVTASSITLNAADVGTESYTINQSSQGAVEFRWGIQVYRSTLQFSNYEQVFNGSAAGLNIDQEFFLQTYDTISPNITFGGLLVDVDGNAITGANSNAAPVPLNSRYDDTLVRILPPKMKFLTLYNEFLVGAFLLKNGGDFGFASLLGNDTRLEDAMVWSDIATLNNGSSVETFLINNIRPIGASEDGQISAIHGNDDNIVVHKEKQSYYVNGDLVNNTLRIRKAMTEQIGSASHRSTKNVDGGHLYATPKGIFVAVGGSKPKELSDIIEPLFTDNALNLGTLEMDKAKSVNDFLREKVYIYVPITGSSTGICLVYDYYYKEWYLHDKIPADKGFQDVGVNSSDIYMADSTGLFRRNLTTKKDQNSKILGRYLTGWFDLDFPSVKKSFNNFLLLSVGALEWTAKIKGFCNWNKTTEVGSGSIPFSSTINVDDFQVIGSQANATAYEISNEDSGDDILITAFEVDYEDNQQVPKGDT